MSEQEEESINQLRRVFGANPDTRFNNPGMQIMVARNSETRETKLIPLIGSAQEIQHFNQIKEEIMATLHRLIVVEEYEGIILSALFEEVDMPITTGNRTPTDSQLNEFFESEMRETHQRIQTLKKEFNQTTNQIKKKPKKSEKKFNREDYYDQQRSR